MDVKEQRIFSPDNFYSFQSKSTESLKFRSTCKNFGGCKKIFRIRNGFALTDFWQNKQNFAYCEQYCSFFKLSMLNSWSQTGDYYRANQDCASNVRTVKWLHENSPSRLVNRRLRIISRTRSRATKSRARKYIAVFILRTDTFQHSCGFQETR